jgi:acyl carrier protein
MTETILDRVRQTAADVFDLDVEDVTPDSSPETIPSWDSQAHLVFVVALESEFGVRFNAALAADMLNIGVTASIVEQRIAQQGT